MTIVYVGLAWLLTILASLGTGFHFGAKNVQADWDKERLHIAQRSEQERTRITKADQQSDKKASQRKAKRKVTRQATLQKVILHVQTLPDPIECWMAPERVSNINAAFGFDSDTGKQAPAVRQTDPSEKREPQRSGAVGGDDG